MNHINSSFVLNISTNYSPWIAVFRSINQIVSEILVCYDLNIRYFLSKVPQQIKKVSQKTKNYLKQTKWFCTFMSIYQRKIK